MANIQEIVEKINSKEVQKKDIAKEMGINPSTLQRRLKKEGYTFDKEADRWILDNAVQTNGRTEEPKKEVSKEVINEQTKEPIKESRKEETKEPSKIVRKRTSFDLDINLVKQFKLKAVTEDKNLYELVEQAMREYLKR